MSYTHPIAPQSDLLGLGETFAVESPAGCGGGCGGGCGDGCGGHAEGGCGGGGGAAVLITALTLGATRRTRQP